MVKKKIKKSKSSKEPISNRSWWIIRLLIVGVLVGIFIFAAVDLFQNSFEVNSFLLKLNIPSGGESFEKIVITNNVGGKNFNLHLENLEGIAYLTEKNFNINSKEKKEITIYFKDLKKETDVYIGRLVIKGPLSTKKIPIVVGVEDTNPYFVILQNPIPNYVDVYPGGKIGMEVKFSNLRDFNLHNIDVEYLIKNLDGETILSEKDTLSLRDSVTRRSPIIDVPKDVELGDYVFITLMQDDTKSSASYFFNIKKKSFNPNIASFNNYILLGILIVIVGVLIYSLYFIKTKTSLFKLQTFQRKELKRNFILIRKYERALRRIENRTEREKKLRELGIKSKVIIRDVKEKQKSQKKEILKLKKVGKKELINAKLKQWEKKGYEMSEFKSKIKVSKKSMGEQMDKWKKKGYNLDMFR